MVATGCLLSRIVWWSAPISSLFPEIKVFYRPERTKRGSHENEFLVFSDSEMNDTNRAQKVDEIK